MGTALKAIHEDAPWLGTDSVVCRAVEGYSRDCFHTYEIDKRRVVADANIERTAIEGGYARRQLFELVQNGADELIDRGGRIEVVLTDRAMYCANQGRSVSARGVGALLGSHSSTKTGLEIGRFGLGFKSVLGVTTAPAVYSRSGSFRFDEARNLERVRAIDPAVKRVATLRFAEPLDPQMAAQSDPVLRELMAWATTVIEMPRDPARNTSWLSGHLKDFPSPFLLFSEHVTELVLDDRTADLRRAITLEKLGDARWRLRETGQRASDTEWRVFATTHRPSKSVKQDGGTMADRDEVPVQWAVPVGRGGDRFAHGFWAFFPTLERTTLSGVLNAPWKLNEDRTRLIEGPFNEELLGRVVDLVVGGLPEMATDGDPGSVLELLPGREKETRGFADSVLIDRVYKALSEAESLPDLDGVFQRPEDLQLHPDGVPVDAIALWSGHSRTPRNWVHASAYASDTRSSRVTRLAGPVGVKPATVTEWLEALVTSADDYRGSALALRVVARLIRTELREAAIRAKIVLTAKNGLVPAQRGSVFLPAEEDVDVDVDVPLIHPRVVERQDARDALGAIGILQVSSQTVLDGLIERSVGSELQNDWTRIWATAAKVSRDQLRELVIDRHGLDAEDVRVRTVGGGWARLSAVLLPGDLLKVEDFRADRRTALVDTQFHARDLDLLRMLGATDRPVAGAGSLNEDWVEAYRKLLGEEAASEARDHGARLRETDFELDVPAGFAGPAGVLDSLTDEAAGRYCRELLANTPDLGTARLVRRDGKVAPKPVEHPLIWRLRRIGKLPTNRGLRAIDECITPFLKEFADLLPVADLPRAAVTALRLPDTAEELDEPRATLALRTLEGLDRPELLGPMYVSLARILPAPPDRLRAIARREIVWARRGAVCAAFSSSDVRVLRGTGTPFVQVPDEPSAGELVRKWGLLAVADAVSSRLVVTEAGPREALVDLFPPLRDVFGVDAGSLSVVPCRNLARELYTEDGSLSKPLDFAVRDGVAYRATTLDDEDFVRHIGDHLGRPLGRHEAQEILRRAHDEGLEALLTRVRAREDDAGKLVELLGGEALRSRIPAGLIEAVEEAEGELDDARTAEVALTAFGTEVLERFSDVLDQRGLRPPTSWAGGRAAVRFVVDDLAMDRRYAGFAAGGPVDDLPVAGPAPLPALLDFQRVAVAQVRAALSAGPGRQGVLFLPAGADRQRTVIEAVTGLVKESTAASHVVWMAKTPQACAQAALTWAEVWRSAGSREVLRITRMYGTVARATQEDEGARVTVATPDEIERLGGADGNLKQLLATASCVVFDEGSGIPPGGGPVTPSFEALDWIGEDRAPIIATASPDPGDAQLISQIVTRYRGRIGEDITSRAAGEPGVFTTTAHRDINGSETVPLTAAERDEMASSGRLPESVREKIGEDLERTTRLVEAVVGLDPGWPVLVFAATESNARLLSALIGFRGRSAAVITDRMPEGARHFLVEEFRRGRVRTLVNFDVLTNAFDAPPCKAMFIARPTFDAERYLQMAERALKHPLAGGDDRCLVVDVIDDVRGPRTKLAAMSFGHLWSADD